MKDNQVANFDLVRFDTSNDTTLQVQSLEWRSVDFKVFSIAVKIIVELLNHGDTKDECEWSDKRDQESDTQRWNDLRQGDDQEEQVEEVLELVKKHLWDEGVPRILAVIDRVAWIPSLSISFSIKVDITQLAEVDLRFVTTLIGFLRALAIKSTLIFLLCGSCLLFGHLLFQTFVD